MPSCRESRRFDAALPRAGEIAEADVAINRAIGEHGMRLIAEAWRRKGDAAPVEILTHCNAGWLATVDWGTALAPIYRAHDDGIPLHVWVDETRPRNQGAGLTAWELGQHGVAAHRHRRQCRRPPDAAGPGRSLHRRHRPHDRGWRCREQDRHLSEGAGGARQRRSVLCRAALADDRLGDRGAARRSRSSAATPARSLMSKAGPKTAGASRCALTPADSPAANYAFDVTPARLVTALDHRARHLRRVARGTSRAVSRTGLVDGSALAAPMMPTSRRCAH